MNFIILWYRKAFKTHFNTILRKFNVASFTEFENLGRAFTKAKNVIDKEGIPPTFIKCLVELEDFIKEVWIANTYDTFSSIL